MSQIILSKHQVCIHTSKGIKEKYKYSAFDYFVCGHVQQYFYHDICSVCKFFHQSKVRMK